jgi:opacity protein-like surface antigen
MRSILLRTWLLLFAFAFGAAAAECQVAPAVNTSKFDLRVGGEFSIFKPDYGAQSLLGFGAYADLDFHRWVGVEAEARSLFLNKYGGKMRTDTGGGGVRFFYPYHKFVPFGKGEIGFGSIDFPNHTFSHETMVMFEIGGGVDYRLSHRVSVRGEYIYQFWPAFLGNRGLNPYGANIGASYRFF